MLDRPLWLTLALAAACTANPRPQALEAAADDPPAAPLRTDQAPMPRPNVGDDDGEGTRIYPDYGQCEEVFGYRRNGPKCEPLSGCGCKGTPTGCPPNYFADKAACEAAV